MGTPHEGRTSRTRRNLSMALLKVMNRSVRPFSYCITSTCIRQPTDASPLPSVSTRPNVRLYGCFCAASTKPADGRAGVSVDAFGNMKRAQSWLSIDRSANCWTLVWACPYLRHEILEHLPVPRLEDAELPAGARRAHDVEGEDWHLAQRALHVLQCQAPPSSG